MKRNQQSSAFTLVELLAVVVIMGLIIAASIPSVHRITAASALGNGTRQFSDQVAMARTYALANAKDVYLLVPYSATQSATLTNTYCYASYGFCISTISPLLPLPPNLLTNVSYIDRIQFLPPGAVFLNQISNIATQSIAFPNSTCTPVNVWCLKINKYGQIPPLTTSPQFSMSQGFVTGYGALTAPQVTFPGTNTITINPLTGKAVVTKS